MKQIDQVHVIDRCVMIVVVQSVGIDKMGMGCAKRQCLPVHQCHKGLHVAADRLRDCHRRVIAAAQHHAVQQLAQGQHIAGRQITHGGIRGLIYRPLADSVLLIQLAVLQSHIQGQQFGGAGRVQGPGDILGVQSLPGGRVEYAGSLGDLGSDLVRSDIGGRRTHRRREQIVFLLRRGGAHKSVFI